MYDNIKVEINAWKLCGQTCLRKHKREAWMWSRPKQITFATNDSSTIFNPFTVTWNARKEFSKNVYASWIAKQTYKYINRQYILFYS